MPHKMTMIGKYILTAVLLIRDLLKTSADQIPIGWYLKILKLNISLSLINIVLFWVEHDLPITFEKFEKVYHLRSH
jgi:hypothetical protein